MRRKKLRKYPLHTETAPAIRAAVKTVVSCQCSRLRFRMLRLKTEETPVFCVCKQKQEFVATEAIKGRVFSNSIVLLRLQER